MSMGWFRGSCTSATSSFLSLLRSRGPVCGSPLVWFGFHVCASVVFFQCYPLQQAFLSDLYRGVVGPCVGARLTRGINLLVLFSCVFVPGFRSTQPSPILLFSPVYNVESWAHVESWSLVQGGRGWWPVWWDCKPFRQFRAPTSLGKTE